MLQAGVQNLTVLYYQIIAKLSRIIRKILNYQKLYRPSGARLFLLKDIAIVELRLVLAATDSCGYQQRI